MFNNYTLKGLLENSSRVAKRKPSSSWLGMLALLLTCFVTNTQAQTTLIGTGTGATGGGDFEKGSTFAANGWTVANQGSGATKWVVGTAVSQSNSGTTQLTNASVTALTQSITLSATNTNIAIGQLVTGSNIQTGTYVTNISGTTLSISRPTTNSTTVTTAFTLTFAAISANITGNSAYVSDDNGLSNGYNYTTARRIYFYRDVTLPSGETAYSLKFDVRSLGVAYSDAWQVLVAPTSVTPTGLDSQSANVLPSGFSTAIVPNELAGAVSLTYGAGILYPQTMFASIPPSFAGQTVRLIFMWTNDASNGASNPAAIDNISLTSRVAGDVNSVASGLFSNPGTWDVGVPTAADNMIINAGNAVSINQKEVTVGSLYVSGASAFLDFGFYSDELAVLADMQVSGTAARFNNYYTTTTAGTGTGKSVKVKGNIDVISGGRFDSSVSSTTVGVGALTFNGSSVQTFTVDSSSFLGSSATALTTSSNLSGIMGQVIFNNTNTATPNINWNASCTADVRIKSTLYFQSGRVAIGGTAKFIIGNYASLSDGTLASPTGYFAIAGQGILNGTVGRYFSTSATSSGNWINSGTDYTVQPYPFINAAGAKRYAFISRPTVTGAVAGEVYVTYTDSSSMATASVTDGTYTIANIYGGTWAFTKDGTYANTAGTDIAFYATGAYGALDGSSRVLKTGNTAATGTHVTGTSSPLAIRSGVTASDLFSGSFKVGASIAATQGAVTKTSAGTGDWNTAGTWTPSGVPSCSDVVVIASGHNVTVSTTASATDLTIATGGTLTSTTGGNLTVGCTNNKATFVNNGTYSISAGTLTVNGSVLHNPGSTLTQTGGNIVVDPNNAGDAATSVGVGGSAFKIDSPAALNLSAGTITIVDPLVNQETATTATSLSTFTAATVASTWGFTTTSITPIGTNTMTFNPFNSPNIFVGSVGSVVTSAVAGIPVGTTIVSQTTSITGSVTITLSANVTAAIANSSAITFSGMANGNATVYLPAQADNSLAVGQIVTGTGIPSGTTVVSAYGGLDYAYLTLSNPVTGLGTSPITTAQTLTFSAASNGCSNIILTAANSAIVAGMAVTGTGIPAGTYVSGINGTVLTLTNTATSSISVPVSLTFYKANPGSYAFVYNSTAHNVAGSSHTLKFGNGTSTDNTSVITNGFLTSLSLGGGVLSLGNLTIDATNTDRFVSNNNKLNVQNTFTVNSGSKFVKTKQLNLANGANDYGAMYLGGNLVNNGTFVTRAQSTTIMFDNLLNGGETPSTIAQTISGSGNFYDNYDVATVGSGGTGAFATLGLNNTSTGGLTIATTNFRIEGAITMNNGIIHTSSTYPLYHGIVGNSLTPQLTFANAYGSNSYIDGPYEKVISTTNTATTYALFPVGNSATYMPISLAIAGGGVYRVQAYTSNTGTASSNISNLSSKRWVASRVGSTGTPTTFNVRVGANDITSNVTIPVMASADQGTYDNTLGATSTFALAVLPGVNVDQVNNVTTTAATAWSNFTGYFSYAQGPACSGTPAPGNTVASASSICGGQSSTMSLQNATTGTGVTYQWQSSTDGTTYSNISGATAATYVAMPTTATYYKCNVTCGGNTGTSTAVQVTISATTITGTTPASICSTAAPATMTLGAAASSGTINWYAAANGGSSLGTGTSFVTPALSTTTTYYVGTDVSTANSFTKTFSGSTITTNNYSGMVFNTTSKIVLNSVKVYPKQTSAGDNRPLTIALFDASGNEIGSPVTFTPTANITTTLPAQVVSLGYTVPTGTGYKLVVIGGLTTLNGLGTNTQTVPFTTGAVNVTNSIASDGAALGTSYLNFYDWSWSEICSTARTAVTATVNTAATYYADADGDTYGNAAVTQLACSQPSGYVTNNTDCDDTNATKWHTGSFYVDADGDGYTVGSTVSLCYGATTPTGYSVTSAGTDCDDTNAAIWHTGSFYVDADGDGYTVGSAVSLCYGASTPSGYAVSSAGSDCNDADASVTTGTNITTQPINPTICNVSGASTTATVVAAGSATLAYQWQMQTGTQTTWTTLSNNSNYSGVSTATLTITRTTTTLPATATRYQVVVSGGTCTNATSATVVLQQLAVAAKTAAIAAVTKLTPALTTCSGSSVTLSLAAGSVGNIQWQSSTDNSTWTNVGTVYTQTAISAANPALTYVTGALTTATYFRVVATNGACGSVSSATPIHILVSTPPTTGSISGGDVTVCAPLAAGFDATGAALTAPITNSTTLSLDGVSFGATIAWQKCINYTATTPTWAAISGATSSSYTASALTVDTWYRALVTNGACSAFSNIVKITVTKSAKAGATTCAATVCYGGDILFTSAAYTGSAIQWQISTTSATAGFSNISGATTSPYTLTGVTLTPLSKFYIRSMVTSGSCTAAYSAVKTITVNPTSVGGTVTGGGTVCNSGLAGTLKLAGNTGTIQWQYSTDGGATYTNAPSSTGTASSFTTTSTGTAATYIVSNVTADTYFRALVTSGACSSTVSNAKAFVVATAATPGTVSAASTTVCSGTGTTLTLSGSVGAIVWQKSVSPFTTWTPVTTSVTPTLNTGNLTATTHYRASVTIGGCSTLTSNEVTISVPAAPLAKAITANVTNPTGAATHPLCTSLVVAKTLTIGSGSNGAIQWQVSTTSATAGFSDISGQTGTSYTISSPAPGVNYYRASFTNSCSVTVYNAAIAVYYTVCLTDGGSTNVVAKGDVPFGVLVAPNPFAENFNLNLTTSSEATVGIKVYDMLGKLIDQHDVNPSEVAGLLIGERYPSGVYNIIVTQGDEVKTLRAVKR